MNAYPEKLGGWRVFLLSSDIWLFLTPSFELLLSAILGSNC
jgi:hypothetical protein